MHKYIFVTLLIIASVGGLYLSFDAVIEAQKHKVDQPASNELRIEAVDFEFDKEEYEVAAGQETVLSLINKDGKHGYSIEELGIEVYEGESVTHTFDTPGTYSIRCNILCGEGHAQMVSTLIVTEASADQPANEDNGH